MSLSPLAAEPLARKALVLCPVDYLGRRLRVGDVVVYAVLIRRFAGGQPLRRGVILGFEESHAWIRMQPDKAQGCPSTVRIHQERVLAMPDALPSHQAVQLRKHALRLRTPSERAQRRGEWPWAGAAFPRPAPITAPFTPEQTLAKAGIDDARQAEYQRKMSALLAGRA
jgi:hypothetical protein